MIARYNFQQVVCGILCLAGSAAAYVVAYVFFSAIPPMFALALSGFAASLGFPVTAKAFGLSPGFFHAVTFVALVLITLSGYRVWKRRGGFYGYHESGLYHQFGKTHEGAGAVADYYARRVTGPAYLISQICLGAPLLALNTITHFRQWISKEEGLEQRLSDTLGYLQRINKWQAISDYPGQEREILLLARMGEIDYSTAKGTMRFKANP